MLSKIFGVQFKSVGEFVGCVVKSLAGVVVFYGGLFVSIVIFSGIGGYMTW